MAGYVTIQPFLDEGEYVQLNRVPTHSSSFLRNGHSIRRHCLFLNICKVITIKKSSTTNYFDLEFFDVITIRMWIM